MNYKRKIIGLTGSISMGKSYIANILIAMNIPVLDSDKEIRKLYSKPQIIKKIFLLFPECFIDQKLDNTLLANTVFSDQNKLNKLEAILYPCLNKEIEKFLSRKTNKNSDIIILDIPLLFEKNYHFKFDDIITVSSSTFWQTKRVLKRNNMSKEKFKNIIKNQFSDFKKRAQADYVIYTGSTKASCVRQVKNILSEIRGE